MQGKAVLIEHFRNNAASVMRNENWRPKSFHSSGPLQGYPEPLPRKLGYSLNLKSRLYTVVAPNDLNKLNRSIENVKIGLHARQ